MSKKHTLYFNSWGIFSCILSSLLKTEAVTCLREISYNAIVDKIFHQTFTKLFHTCGIYIKCYLTLIRPSA